MSATPSSDSESGFSGRNNARSTTFIHPLEQSGLCSFQSLHHTSSTSISASNTSSALDVLLLTLRSTVQHGFAMPASCLTSRLASAPPTQVSRLRRNVQHAKHLPAHVRVLPEELRGGRGRVFLHVIQEQRGQGFLAWELLSEQSASVFVTCFECSEHRRKYVARQVACGYFDVSEKSCN